MKKARKIICIAIIAVLVVILIMCNSINANAYEVKLSSNNSTVNSDDTFTVTMSLSEAASVMNVRITYDENLFSYVNGTYNTNDGNEGLEINEGNKGVIPIVYNPVGDASLEYISFQFKANNVTEEKTGKISIENDIAIVVNDSNSYLGRNNISIIDCNVTVKPKQQEEAKPPVITPSGNVSVKVGETKKLTSDKDVTWSSSDNSIATVDENGNVKGIKEGTAIITATDKTTGKTTTVTIIVNGTGNTDDPNSNKGAPVITPSGNVSLKPGESKQMTADQDVTWKSTDESVVTVDSTGKITAVGKGTAIIIATNSNGQSTNFTVTVDDSGAVVDNGNENGNENAHSDSGSNGSGSQSGGSSTGSSSTGGSSTGSSSTGGSSTSTGSSSSTAEETVPATGESTVETVVILAIITLIVASIIFRRKSKIK